MMTDEIREAVEFIKANTPNQMEAFYKAKMNQILSEGLDRIDKLTDEQLDGILNDQILAS